MPQDVDSKKRKLHALLAAGTPQDASYTKPSPPTAGLRLPVIPQEPVSEPNAAAGGFFREALPNQSDRRQYIQYAEHASKDQESHEEGLDDSWIGDDNDVDIAVRVCCSRFPKRRYCPPLALYTQLKDLLKGQSNLELDRELKRLQDSRSIVMFKFTTSACDVAVTPYSEFQKVLDKIADTSDEGTSTGPQQKEAVWRLGRLLKSGKFSVQMRTDELEKCLASADKDVTQANQDLQGSANPQANSETQAGGNPSRAELHMRKSGLPIGSKHKSRGFQQESSAGEDAKYVDCLLQAGLLVRHRMGAVEVMRLTAPGAGSVMASVDRARNEIRGALKRKQRKEAIEKTLVATSLKSSTLGWPFHISDMVGAGIIERITHGNNTVLRLRQKS